MNITLIGMPGCGKSTLGVLLAKALGYRFLDTDLLIQERENRLLSVILEEEGLEAFLRIENEVNAGVEANRTVIAPGGSVVYGKEAMEHLKKISRMVYLRLPCETVAARIGNPAGRGVAMRGDMTLRQLYEERCPLYERYADIVIDADGLDTGELLARIKKKLFR